MAHQAKLTALSPREAVADALYRFLLGIDTNNHELFKSACVADETMSVSAGGFVINGWDAINEFFQRVFVLNTTHITSTVRVEIKDGANTATLTCTTISYHVRPEAAFVPEDTSYTAGTLYFMDLVKDEADDLWKIKKWEAKTQWTTGDRSVIHG